MKREDAVKKLGKLLGKCFGYRVDRDAPGADEHAEAKAQLPTLRTAEEQAEAAMKARREAILAADLGYQTLVEDYRAARARRHAASSAASRYKITVGVTTELFFHIRAQGHSWEDVIEKLTSRGSADQRRATPAAAAE